MTMPNKRSTTVIDQIIGQNIQTLRITMGLTRAELAKHLEITQQQLQKYEKGANRITCNRVWQIAQLSGANVEQFFAHLDSVEPPQALPSFSRGDIGLYQAFHALECKTQRDAIIRLMRVMVGEESSNNNTF